MEPKEISIKYDIRPVNDSVIIPLKNTKVSIRNINNKLVEYNSENFLEK